MEKFKVAICDDVPLVTSVLENYLAGFPSCIFECDCFNNGNRLKKMLKKDNYHIYLLDIDLPDSSGIEIAREIRKYDLNAYIVFITSYQDYIQDVFEVNTFDYLLKPIDKENLFQTIERILIYIKNDDTKFTYFKKNSCFFVAMKDIVYFEKQGRYVVLYTQQYSDKFIMTTGKLLEKLNKNFVQIHTSYIINLNFLKRIKGDQIFLDIDPLSSSIVSTLRVSRKYKKSTKNMIMDFMEAR
ncbi:LytR/AlgR family response regulator transcription factor [Enterococcus innesii]|uniref:LytR/AlgR family response regulator transcription factor n=1 Tax=Enterococcus innesii TaxID=2839759 RepID=UPI002091967E|nr:LytTR family DNA-binding domain-containing protein [Enterococcus innesii]MCO5496162.1 LytTR family DNA-binding domain-containing protein [Enterococcus innesii]